MTRQDDGLMQTMGNLRPDMDALSFKVKTGDVEEWMQEVFDSVSVKMRKNNPNARIPSVSVKLITLKASSNYAPFVIALSKNVLVDGGRKGGRGNEREYAQFDVKSDDPSVKIIKEFFTLIGAWMYNKDDMKGICSNEGRRRLGGLTRSEAAYLSSIRVPKLMPFNGSEMVVALIDPLRVFWMMLRDPKRPKDTNYHVDVESFKMVSKSTAEFKIVRKVNHSKNMDNLQEAMADAFSKKLRG